MLTYNLNLGNGFPFISIINLACVSSKSCVSASLTANIGALALALAFFSSTETEN